MSGGGDRPPAPPRGRATEPQPRVAPFIVLFVAAVMLFNFPLLLIWDQPVTVLGLPLLGVALFAIWGGLILALALVSEKRGGESRGGENHADKKRAIATPADQDRPDSPAVTPADSPVQPRPAPDTRRPAG